MTSKTRAKNKPVKPAQTNTILSTAFKAGFWGGLGISALLLVYQISFPLKTALIPPAMIIVWIVTGIGAAMLMGSDVETSQDGRKVGVIAGIVSGTIAGITAMIIAAFGSTFGQLGILEQFSEAQLKTLTESGFTDQLIIVAGQIIAALFACGIGGIIVSGLLGGFGGWLYPKLNK